VILLPKLITNATAFSTYTSLSLVGGAIIRHAKL